MNTNLYAINTDGGSVIVREIWTSDSPEPSYETIGIAEPLDQERAADILGKVTVGNTE